MCYLHGIASICQPVDLSPSLESRHINKCVFFMLLPQYVNQLTCNLHQKVITLPNRFPTIIYLNMSVCLSVTCFRRLTHQQMCYLHDIASICQPVDLSPSLESRHINKCAIFMILPQYVNLLTCHLH